MKNVSSWLKWTWSGGPSPGLCHAMRTEMAPPVASVVRSTFMSRPKGLIGSACSGLVMTACSGEGLVSMFVSGLSFNEVAPGHDRVRPAVDEERLEDIEFALEVCAPKDSAPIGAAESFRSCAALPTPAAANG